MHGKHIVLGITGSIAAYKACTLVRLLRKAGAEVQTVVTPSALEFVTPLTLSTLSQRPCISEFFSRRDGSWNSHVALGEWADAMMIAPATASTLAKMATGQADNMLLTTYLSMRAPVFVAPAMDLDMYAHASTQTNLRLLQERGVRVVEPATGFLASGLEGKGRMEEPEQIFAALQTFFAQGQQLQGKTVLVTAGPTYERIDPVRFIGNYSSGKMGYAIARSLCRRGAHVVLVSGPTSLSLAHPNLEVVSVESAAQMYDACTARFPQADGAVLCGAVADFTPDCVFDTKIKREGNVLNMRLVPTRDIAAALGAQKRKGQVLAGFALETNDELAHARQKLQRKNFDFIVLNSLRDAGAGFRTDTNKVTILTPTSEQAFPLKSKSDVADDIVDALCRLLCP
ncbi:MAG: bifunctional phosphopantothenoylcysteine decarboxylase/phosphopantothenate--cysteine ligase CoaBC [Alloprevotella sp.]|nr:bifunctional phosphopantothenoylcysteine decarboxylase/phosphopantothenate--cysteine ligase CoaBC [Alloprevotella sp.]